MGCRGRQQPPEPAGCATSHPAGRRRTASAVRGTAGRRHTGCPPRLQCRVPPPHAAFTTRTFLCVPKMYLEEGSNTGGGGGAGGGGGYNAALARGARALDLPPALPPLPPAARRRRAAVRGSCAAAAAAAPAAAPAAAAAAAPGPFAGAHCQKRARCRNCGCRAVGVMGRGALGGAPRAAGVRRGVCPDVGAGCGGCGEQYSSDRGQNCKNIHGMGRVAAFRAGLLRDAPARAPVTPAAPPPAAYPARRPRQGRAVAVKTNQFRAAHPERAAAARAGLCREATSARGAARPAGCDIVLAGSLQAALPVRHPLRDGAGRRAAASPASPIPANHAGPPVTRGLLVAAWGHRAADGLGARPLGRRRRVADAGAAAAAQAEAHDARPLAGGDSVHPGGAARGVRGAV